MTHIDTAPLTDRQLECKLAFQELVIRGGGAAPKLRELSARLGIEPQAVYGLLERLEQKGHMRRPREGERGWKMVGRCPYCGHVGGDA